MLPKAVQSILLWILCGITLFATACAAPATPIPAPEKKSAPSAAGAAAPAAAPAVKEAAPKEAAPAAGGQLMVGLSFEPSGMDPHADLHHLLPFVIGSVYDTLVYRPADGKFQPGLATSWEISPDGLSYTFKLRQGVKFHDGTPFNADAVKFSFDRIVDPETKSRNAIDRLGPYRGSEVLDPYTIKVNLKEPYAPFLDSASQTWLAIVSPAAVKKWGKDYAMHQVGTGPFTMKEYVPKSHVALLRNPDYNWASPAFKHQGPAYLESLTIRFIPESTTRVGALRTGELGFVDAVPPVDFEAVKADTRLRTHNVPSPGMPMQFTINSNREPTDSLEVRQALIYATNRQQIAQTLSKGVYPVLHSTINPSTWGYNKAVENIYSYDPVKAKELLDKSGWRPGADGIRAKDGKPLSLALYTYESGPNVPLAELLQAQLRDVGVKVEIKVVAPLAYTEASNKGEHNLTVRNGRRPSDPGYLNSFYVSGGRYDWTKHKIDRLNDLLKQGLQVSDEAKRAQIYAEIQDIIMKQGLALPLYDVAELYASRTEVQGLAWDHRADPVFYDVNIRR